MDSHSKETRELVVPGQGQSPHRIELITQGCSSVSMYRSILLDEGSDIRIPVYACMLLQVREINTVIRPWQDDGPMQRTAAPVTPQLTQRPQR